MTFHSDRFLPSPQGHNRRIMPGYFTLFLGLFLLATPGFSMIRYVKPVASGSGNGTSWANASAGLQAMINASAPGDEVWVAAGTYKPTSGNDRNISFSMKNGVAIYGGFAGGETALAQRNWRTNVTILSGDIGAAADSIDNSLHVVLNNGLNGSAILDGFTIRDGNDNVSAPNSLGGGMLNNNSSPKVSNCIFLNNIAGSGGGMANQNGSSPSVINCIFRGNKAGSGGGMSNYSNSSPTVKGCLFSGNQGNIGGGMINWINSSPTITNCTFSGNKADSGNGGGIINKENCRPTLLNCILWGNTDEIVSHSYTDPNVTYSIVEGGYQGTGNLNTDPLFVNQPPKALDEDAGDLHLDACSPAIDAAALNGNVPSNDLDGAQRPFNATGAPTNKPDMGAYEYSSTTGNHLSVSIGSISSFGDVNGTYTLSADTYQAAQGANTQTNCPCWTRTKGKATFPVSIGKIDGEWLFFKSATCPENPFSVLVAPIGNSSDCNPTSIPRIRRCP